MKCSNLYSEAPQSVATPCRPVADSFSDTESLLVSNCCCSEQENAGSREVEIGGCNVAERRLHARAHARMVGGAAVLEKLGG